MSVVRRDRLPRAHDLRERMDDPTCDPVRLTRTFAQFGILNDLLSGWRRAWRTVLRPHARAAAREAGVATLLDVGCGGGDVARRLARWAADDGVPLAITAIDRDPRALAFARARPTPAGVTYAGDRPGEDVPDLLAAGRHFDLVVSNHVLHHLPEDELASFLTATDALAVRAVLHDDLFRTPWALPAFAVFALPFRGSFVAVDGRRSIRRAWRPDELAPHLPPGARAARRGAFRLRVLREASTP
ncbi:MAG: methyltransferase domain-containing protein [Trueperaceae bacterium]|nr:methyltransferase domain-containing protein [Trueperaceae bacterium]